MEVLFDWIVYMVQSAGLEPATSSFAGRRSNPTELRLQMVPKVGLEPTHRMASASKTDVSTNSTIWAKDMLELRPKNKKVNREFF